MSEVIFKCYFAVPFHGTKKLQKNKISKTRADKIQSRVNLLKEFIERKILIEKIKQRIDTPIDHNIQLCLKFYFPESIFNLKRLPDLAGLYELPQAVLAATGVIASVSLVQSFDGSRRLPTESNNCSLSIEITKVD